ncbi:MAG TPA: hypothetical protein VJ783_19600, partial [Pirellulales bacterium]|nr:hypothetical protein [Pirellulales bacterium]
EGATRRRGEVAPGLVPGGSHGVLEWRLNRPRDICRERTPCRSVSGEPTSHRTRRVGQGVGSAE